MFHPISAMESQIRHPGGLLGALALAALGLLSAGCQESGPLPLHMDRDDLIRRAESRFDEVVKIPFETHYDLLLPDGSVVGEASESLSLTGGPLLGEPELRSERYTGGTTTEVSMRFSRAYPHRLLSVRATETRHGITTEILDERFSKGDRGFTLVDHYAKELWLDMNPERTGSVVAHAFDFLNPGERFKPIAIRFSEARKFESHPLAHRMSSVLRTNDEKENTAYSAYGPDGRLLFMTHDDGLELRPNPGMNSSIEREGHHQVRRAKYLLPSEIPAFPKNYELVKAATVKICSNLGCGTGTFVSNEGHLLTAAHVLPPKLSDLRIPELEGEIEVTGFTVLGHGHADAAIVHIRPVPKGKLGSDHSFFCVPAAQVSPAANQPVWTLGFPKASQSGGDHYSDGIHEFTTFGKTLERPHHASAESMSENSDMRYLRLLRQGHLLLTDAVITHGFSGGPVLNLQGELLGHSVGIRRFTETASSRRGDNDEGTHHMVFNIGSVMNFLELDRGREEAARMLDCMPKEVPPGIHATQRADRGDQLEDVLSGEAIGEIERIEALQTQWITEFTTRLKSDERLSRHHDLWSMLQNQLLLNFTRFSARQTLTTRLREGTLVLPQDLYPAIRYSDLLSAWTAADMIENLQAIARTLFEAENADLSDEEAARFWRMTKSWPESVRGTGPDSGMGQ